MKQTIAKLWFGEISPEENCDVYDPEMDQLFRLLERNRNALDEILDKPQKELFAKFTDCYDEYMSELSMRAFGDGFCLASRLWAEAMSSGI